MTPLASHHLERYLSCGALQSLSSDVSGSGGGWEGLELSFTTLGQHDVEDACWNGRTPQQKPLRSVHRICLLYGTKLDVVYRFCISHVMVAEYMQTFPKLTCTTSCCSNFCQSKISLLVFSFHTTFQLLEDWRFVPGWFGFLGSSFQKGQPDSNLKPPGLKPPIYH